VVYDVVQQVFNGTLDRGYNRAIAFDLFRPIAPPSGSDASTNEQDASYGLLSTKDITDRILDGQAISDKSQAEKNMRLGYMGHLTLIAEEVCKFANRTSQAELDRQGVVVERVNRPEWMAYVEGTLAETRERDNAVLGGVRPENAIGMRAGGGGNAGGFSSNTASALANAGITPQDTVAMSEGTVGQSFEINSGTLLSGFGDGSDDDDEEMGAGEIETAGERLGMGDRTESGGSSHSAFSDDEQVGELSFEDVDMDYR